MDGTANCTLGMEGECFDGWDVLLFFHPLVGGSPTLVPLYELVLVSTSERLPQSERGGFRERGRIQRERGRDPGAWCSPCILVL